MWDRPLSWHAVYVLAVIRVLIIGCWSLAMVILLSKSQLAVVPTSTCAFYVITLLICDEVIRFGFLGLVIHFANLLSMFEVTTLAHWISLTSYIASKQFPDVLCSFICVTAECLATNWGLINFALLAMASRISRARQGNQVKCIKSHRHLTCSRANLSKNYKKTETKNYFIPSLPRKPIMTIIIVSPPF